MEVMLKKYPIRPDIKGRAIILPQRTGKCLLCGKDLSFDLRRKSFCKDNHFEKYYKKFVYSESRKHNIFSTDYYKCVQCGFDPKEFSKEIEEKFPFNYGKYGDKNYWKKRIEYIESFGFSNNASYLEIDHIIPIRMGGDPLAPENQQTLCYPCHKKKTKIDIGNMTKINAICQEVRNYWKYKKNEKKLLGFFK